MPEPITIASAVGAIVVNGIKLCLSVYGTIDGIKQAPKHLKAVSSDLKDFYSILGTIQGYLDDKDLTQGLLHTQSCDNLQSVLANCVSVLRDFDKIVGGYIKAGQESSVTRWQKILVDLETRRCGQPEETSVGSQSVAERCHRNGKSYVSSHTGDIAPCVCLRLP
jgi:hypothetical protein